MRIHAGNSIAFTALFLTLAGCGERSAKDTPESAPMVLPSPHGNPDVDPGDAGTPAPAPEAPAADPSGLLSTSTITADGIVMTVPTQWTSQPPDTSMRRAQFSAATDGGSPVIVAVFGGIGGSVESNIDRWVQQIAEPTSEMVREARDVGALRITHITLTGTLQPSPMMGGPDTPQPGTMLLGAVIEGGPQGIIFMKVTGPIADIERERARWDAMLNSARVRG